MISEHVYEGTIVGAPAAQLTVEGGRISLDARRAPHVQASLRCHLADSSDLDLLDPRTGARIQFDVVAEVGTRLQSRTFNLGLRRRPIPAEGGSYTLTLASDEALLDDWKPLANIDLGALDGRALVNAVLDEALPGTDLEPGVDFTISLDADEEARLWKAGDSAVAFLRPILQAAGLRLVCDEQRRWTLRNEDYGATGTLNVRTGANLMGGEDSIDRDAGIWFDAAIARYRWRDSAGDQQERVDAYAADTPYSRAETFDFDTPYPGPGFAEYAVRRARGRGREVTFTMRLDWAARAEQPVFITLADAPYQVGATQSIEFDLDTHQLTGVTRTVEAGSYAYIVGPVGVSYDDIPAGMSYEEFDWSAI